MKEISFSTVIFKPGEVGYVKTTHLITNVIFNMQYQYIDIITQKANMTDRITISIQEAVKCGFLDPTKLDKYTR